MHNRAPLPSDRGFIIRSDIPPVESKLTVEKVRDLILSANKKYRAIFTSMFQGGMDIASFLYWNEHGYADTIQQLRTNPDILKIRLPGRKKSRNVTPFHTYLLQDAIDELTAYLPTRPDTDHEGKPTTAIFYSKHRKPITENALRLYWLRHLERIGLIDRSHGEGKRKRYGLNIRELRDTFRSQWEKSPAKGSVAEYCMGHQIDPLQYNKAHRDETWTRSEYRKATPNLQILTSTTPYGLADFDTIEQLRTRIEAQEKEIQTLKARTWNISQMVITDDERIKQYVEGWMKKHREELGIPKDSQ
jgi:hypothetical protein